MYELVDLKSLSEGGKRFWGTTESRFLCGIPSQIQIDTRKFDRRQKVTQTLQPQKPQSHTLHSTAAVQNSHTYSDLCLIKEK